MKKRSKLKKRGRPKSVLMPRDIKKEKKEVFEKRSLVISYDCNDKEIKIYSDLSANKHKCPACKKMVIHCTGYNKTYNETKQEIKQETRNLF